MDNLAYKFNRFIISIIAVGPFVAYFMYIYLDAMDFFKVIQLFSFIGVFLLLIFRDRSKPLIFPKYLLFYLLFIFYDFYSTIEILGRDFKIIWLFSNRLIGGFAIMFIIENLYIPKKYFRLLLKVSRIILIIAILIILLQQVVNPNIFIRTDLINEMHTSTGDEDRLHSIYSWLGLLSVGFSFIPIFLLTVEDLDRKKKKIMLWVLAGILFALLSKSRWIMVNALLVSVILFVNHKNNFKRFSKYLILLPFTLLLFFFALKPIGIDVEGIVKDRILESKKGGMMKGSASSRILAFEAFNKFYWDNSLFGKGNIKYGMGGTGKQDYKLRKFLGGHSSQIHVGYLSLFYMYGLIGGFLFLLFLFYLLKKLYLNAKRIKIWAPFLGLLGFAIANLTLVAFSIFEMGLIIALVADRFYNQNEVIRKRLNG